MSGERFEEKEVIRRGPSWRVTLIPGQLLLVGRSDLGKFTLVLGTLKIFYEGNPFKVAES